MILPIYLYGHPVLRTPTEEVTPDYPDLRQLIANMRETMRASDGIGIAAPQVGLSLRLIYIDVDVLKGDMPELAGVHLTLINPQLTVDETVPVMTREEGCLSLPGIHENVPRHERVHLVWWDEDWQLSQMVTARSPGETSSRPGLQQPMTAAPLDAIYSFTRMETSGLAAVNLQLGKYLSIAPPSG